MFQDGRLATITSEVEGDPEATALLRHTPEFEQAQQDIRDLKAEHSRRSVQFVVGADAYISEDKDFSSYAYLGNMGTVSLPLTAALAEERGFLRQGDRVAFLGIGSGLNCLMLGLRW